jgi:hypothetical protein
MKHEQMIRAALDGAVIQPKRTYESQWYLPFPDKRTAVAHMCAEYADWEYRVKPPDPVIEVRYGKASCIDYVTGDHERLDNRTSWTRKPCGQDNVKATFTDGVLTSLEVYKRG